MKLKEHLVTVILPVHNAGKYLPECLDSLKEQTYQNLQVIAIDDHSGDNSFAVLNGFKRKYKNIEVYRNIKRYGLATCYNRAMRNAKGRFIAFMNPNDISAPSRLKRQMNFLLKNPKTVAVGTQYTKISLESKKLEKSALPEDSQLIYDGLLQGSIHPETVMLNRALLPKDLLYFKSSKYPFMFTEVFLKLFQYGTVSNIANSLYYHRRGVKRSGRRSKRLRQMVSMMKLWFNSRSDKEYRIPLRSLVTPLVKGV